MTVWTGAAAFIGAGNLAGFNGSLNIRIAEAHLWSASGNLNALATKRPNRIAASFNGAGGVVIITIAPRLVASASFIGNGRFSPRAGSQAAVLSTSSTNRMSFPTHPNPSDPFQRRPSKGYNNYAISVRFTGAGRVTAIAS
jgi:hypothetical protein